MRRRRTRWSEEEDKVEEWGCRDMRARKEKEARKGEEPTRKGCSSV